MKTTLAVGAAAVIAVLALAGCNQAQSPEKVQHDIAKADAAAGRESGRAEAREEHRDAAADNKLAAAEDKADKQTTDAAADKMVADADGANKIALAKCEALSGDAQSACKDQANAALDMTKAKAKAMKAHD